MLTTVKRSNAVTKTLAASDVFGKYKRERKEAVRAVDVKESEAFKQILEVWKRFLFAGLHPNYDIAIDLAKGLNYSAKDVENFSIALAEFQDEAYFDHRAGMFLSALINNGKDDSYTIRVSHISRKLIYLGYKNTKNVQVYGDLNADVGYGMKSGLLVVHGEVRARVGKEMKGGKIIINGNMEEMVGSDMNAGEIVINGDVGAYVGASLKGGKIKINGSVGYKVGEHMHGGEIVIRKNAGSDTGAFMRGGKIIIKGNAGSGLGDSMDIYGIRRADGKVIESKVPVIVVHGNAQDYIGENIFFGRIYLHGKYKKLGNTRHLVHGGIYHKGSALIERNGDLKS